MRSTLKTVIDTEFINKKFKESQSRLSLTLLFAGTVFAILLAVLTVVAISLILLTELGVIAKSDSTGVSLRELILFMILISVVLGALCSFIFGRFFMKPINVIINMMNRLAAGNFKSRISFDGVLAKHPTAVELSNSINTMASELENTELLRENFINDFSHEFKTPIVSIAGFAKLLKDPSLSEKQRLEYIDIIEEESRRLSNMATNVLNLTKIENQTILTDICEFNLSEQIRTAFLVLEEKWAQKNIDLSLDFDEYTISGNKELLLQVWINLIDNAVKFTTDGGRVSASIKAGKDRCAVTVSNSGSHIPSESRERVFQKFYQCDKSHSTLGNGIGLAVVKRIVDLHGGTVELTSEDDMTSFTVNLPVKQ